jgi:hypothetical protein
MNIYMKDKYYKKKSKLDYKLYGTWIIFITIGFFLIILL